MPRRQLRRLPYPPMPRSLRARRCTGRCPCHKHTELHRAGRSSSSSSALPFAFCVLRLAFLRLRTKRRVSGRWQGRCGRTQLRYRVGVGHRLNVCGYQRALGGSYDSNADKAITNTNTNAAPSTNPSRDSRTRYPTSTITSMTPTPRLRQHSHMDPSDADCDTHTDASSASTLEHNKYEYEYENDSTTVMTSRAHSASPDSSAWFPTFSFALRFGVLFRPQASCVSEYPDPYPYTCGTVPGPGDAELGSRRSGRRQDRLVERVGSHGGEGVRGRRRANHDWPPFRLRMHA
ncbi:hypothetical protein B0H16DRAFT_585450 [Mycena metata]|uniref:Uncharacterized protein n=1 Tax=Mycena metata TaxID=1033252 RepID=A0AAD7J912_9AGAR|nr:hypothetical protein B0H16DRAFT_585450 [Mycena metata]